MRSSFEDNRRTVWRDQQGDFCWLEPNRPDHLYRSLAHLLSPVLDTVGDEFVQRNMRKIVTQLERSTALGLFVVYCIWNAYWLLQWRLPPSLFSAITGLPCPTTGGTRSV